VSQLEGWLVVEHEAVRKTREKREKEKEKRTRAREERSHAEVRSAARDPCNAVSKFFGIIMGKNLGDWDPNLRK